MKEETEGNSREVAQLVLGNNKMDKRLIKIIIVASIVILIALLLFAFIVRKNPGYDAGESMSGGNLPVSGENGGNKSRNLGDDESSNTDFKPLKLGALTQLTKVAVSGASFYGTTTAFYMEKSTGHVYKIGLDGTGMKRISNTTIPKTFEALWSPKGDKLAVRYFEDSPSGGMRLVIKNFLADIGGLIKNNSASTTGEISATSLPAIVAEITVSPSEDKIFYLNYDDDVASGIVSDFKNKNQRKIFEMPFGEFNVSWPIKNTIVLLTKPSSKAEGYLYFLNEKTGVLNRVISGIKGLTANVSPAGDKIIYSENNTGGVETKIYDIKNEKSEEFGIITFPEKCAWGKKDKKFVYCFSPEKILSGDYPDKWYQGVASFDDFVWSKNLVTGEILLLSRSFGADAVNPIVSEDDGYFIFTNKVDGTLWSLKLK